MSPEVLFTIGLSIATLQLPLVSDFRNSLIISLAINNIRVKDDTVPTNMTRILMQCIYLVIVFMTYLSVSLSAFFLGGVCIGRLHSPHAEDRGRCPVWRDLSRYCKYRHVKEFTLLNDPECRAQVKICNPSPLMVTSQMSEKL